MWFLRATMFAVEGATATKLHVPAAFVILQASWDRHTKLSVPVAIVEAIKDVVHAQDERLAVTGWVDIR